MFVLVACRFLLFVCWCLFSGSVFSVYELGDFVLFFFVDWQSIYNMLVQRNF